MDNEEKLCPFKTSAAIIHDGEYECEYQDKIILSAKCICKPDCALYDSNSNMCSFGVLVKKTEEVCIKFDALNDIIYNK